MPCSPGSICGPDDKPPHEYERIRITVAHQGRSRTAWTYVYGWPVNEAHRITSGDFLGDSILCSLFVLDGTQHLG